jgi:hypothetical protein
MIQRPRLQHPSSLDSTYGIRTMASINEGGYLGACSRNNIHPSFSTRLRISPSENWGLGKTKTISKLQTSHVSAIRETQHVFECAICLQPSSYFTLSSSKSLFSSAMFSPLSLVARLSLIHRALSHITLNDQCWHEHPLSTVNICSSVSGYVQYASVVQVTFRSQEQDHTPWSNPPICTNVLESINDKLCVYTNTSFSNGRGISIFTTPQLANMFTSLPAFQDPATADAQDINIPTDTWRATSIPNKGIGIIASKPLDFKDCITAHTPAFLAYLEDELSTLDREKWWSTAIEQLPAKIRKQFLALSYVYGDERVRVQDIVKANTFQVEVGGVNHLAIFPETSRLNHACNAKYVDTIQFTSCT